jgi:hypothetical protein
MINPGGKPVMSLVPFAVIMFECTILFGALFTAAWPDRALRAAGWGLDRPCRIRA